MLQMILGKTKSKKWILRVNGLRFLKPSQQNPTFILYTPFIFIFDSL